MSSPTLKTIKMVEKALKTSEYSIVKISELKRSLPKQVNHNTLIQVLLYLEESEKILVSVKGIFWIHNPSKKFQQALKNSYRYPDDFPQFSRKKI
jgi:hypothetical protein